MTASLRHLLLALPMLGGCHWIFPYTAAGDGSATADRATADRATADHVKDRATADHVKDRATADHAVIRDASLRDRPGSEHKVDSHVDVSNVDAGAILLYPSPMFWATPANSLGWALGQASTTGVFVLCGFPAGGSIQSVTVGAQLLDLVTESAGAAAPTVGIYHVSGAFSASSTVQVNFKSLAIAGCIAVSLRRPYTFVASNATSTVGSSITDPVTTAPNDVVLAIAANGIGVAGSDGASSNSSITTSLTVLANQALTTGSVAAAFAAASASTGSITFASSSTTGWALGWVRLQP
jgi:hypothetical protein